MTEIIELEDGVLKKIIQGLPEASKSLSEDSKDRWQKITELFPLLQLHPDYASQKRVLIQMLSVGMATLLKQEVEEGMEEDE